MRSLSVFIAVAVAGTSAGASSAPADDDGLTAAMANAYAAQICSCLFTMNKDMAYCSTDDFYPFSPAIRGISKVDVSGSPGNETVLVSVPGTAIAARATHRRTAAADLGCTSE